MAEKYHASWFQIISRLALADIVNVIFMLLLCLEKQEHIMFNTLGKAYNGNL